MMSQDAKNRTCESLKGMTIDSMVWSPPDENGDGHWVMTFTNGSEICFSRMMAEL